MKHLKYTVSFQYSKQSRAGVTIIFFHFKCEIKKCAVKVFDQPSRSETMVVKVETDLQTLDTKSLAEVMINTSVFVSWPHLYEALVIRVSDEDNTYYPNGRVEKTEINKFNMESSSIKTHHMSRMAIDVGEVNQIVYVKPNIGHEYVFTNKMYKLQKTWSNIEVAYPAQVKLENIRCFFSLMIILLPVRCARYQSLHEKISKALASITGL